jgi:fido (protein-threonine AMPylation protein)
MATHRNISAEILDYLRVRLTTGQIECAPDAITLGIEGKRPTVNRHLAKMAAAGVIRKLYGGPATRYALPESGPVIQRADTLAPKGSAFKFPVACQALIGHLTAPIGTRQPATYLRTFIDDYIPNQSSLLPPGLATQLFDLGRARGQQPAGTYARKVLEQLLIDLSWHSSRLEGNRKSLLDTKELFARGHADEGDVDALMLLNHKEAIEFVVDTVPHYGISEAVVRNIQAVLMQGLLPNPDGLGMIRETVVTIIDATYLPLQVPQLLGELLKLIIEKARHIKNPIEAAFFMWVNIAYLQPFQDGNERTSRLCANLPLLLQNCAPLSFLDVEQDDYALAVLGVYEQQNVSLAVELFTWTYRRSIDKYAVLLEAMGAPDQFRQRYRERLGDGIRRVVVDGLTVETVVTGLEILVEDRSAFTHLLRQELTHLEAFNCARYRLGIPLTERWVQAGRPGI